MMQQARGLDEIGFEEVEHTADWALRIRGRDLRELLINAARGMSQLLAPDLAQGSQDQALEITVTGYDAESLLVNWLSELAYWAEMAGLVFHTFTLHKVTPTSLRATVEGRPVSELQKHIKAVTYHNLQIQETAQGLEATVVFDV